MSEATSGEVKAGPTPGPWGFEHHRFGGVYTVASSSRCDHVVEIDDDHAEAEANARLIAAAPELLAALIECSERLHSYADHCDSVTDGHLYDMVRSVIRKAQGGT